MSFEMAVPAAPDEAWPSAGSAGAMALLRSLCSLTTWFSPFVFMYGFQPWSHVMMALATEKLQQVKDFLKYHQEMLRWARLNI